MSGDREILAAARTYLERGFMPLPIPAGKKGPTDTPGWERFTTTPDDLWRHFDERGNIGILLGPASKGLVDVDLDCDEARALAPEFLPDTRMVHGRASTGPSHYWYVCDDSPGDPVRYEAPGRSTLVELRGRAGLQTMVPPSVHPSGELVTWHRDGAPARVPARELRDAVQRVAAASLLARNWPNNGARHASANALEGALLRAGWSPEDTQRFIRATARVAGDEEWNTRAAAPAATKAKLDAGEAIPGLPKLRESFDAKIVAKVCEWLDIHARGARDAYPYSVRDGRICVAKEGTGPDGEVKAIHVPLCNFSAEISEVVNCDDGSGDVRREFTIKGTTERGVALPAVRIAAGDFESMSSIGERWAPAAVVSAGRGRRDELREAVQKLSAPTERTIFQHTGWRKIDGEWCYLHNGGAIGREGVSVELGSPLDRYALPEISNVAGIALSLRILDAAPATVAIPLLAAVFLAPLSSIVEPDFTVFLVGPTGSLKTELATLAIQYFGEGFSRKRLPSNWTDTENAIEARLFVAKDAVCVLDDYAPQPTPTAQRALEAKAERVIRNIGNRASRGRLRSDLTQRPDRPPRGLVISTGEDAPPGASIRARLAILDVERGKLNLDVLSEVQRGAALLSAGMRGYLEWLRPNLDGLKTRGQLDEMRAEFTGGHLRAPEMLAQLHFGFVCFTLYATEIGVIDVARADELRAASKIALRSLGTTQTEHATENPADRIVEVLRQRLLDGRCFLVSARDHRKSLADTPPARCIGWRDEAFAYVLPKVLREIMSEDARAGGAVWPFSPQATNRALLEKGVIVVGKDSPTPAETFDGRKHRVYRVPLARLNVAKETGEAPITDEERAA